MHNSIIILKLNNYDMLNLEMAVKKIMDNLKISFRGKRLLIKPNFVCPRQDATTDIKLVEAVIKVLSPHNELIIGEGSGYEFDTEKTFEILGVYKLGEKYGVPVINLRKERTKVAYIGGKVLKKIRLPMSLFDVDGIINMPKLKTHTLTGFTFAMKNLLGLLNDDYRRLAHIVGLNQAIVDLAKFFAPLNLLTIGDGIKVMGGEGPAFGDVFQANLLIAGRDNFAIDYYAAKIIGFLPEEVKYINLALKQGLIDKYGDFEYSEVINIPKPTASFFYRFIYWLVYVFDLVPSFLLKKSLIPQIITKFGTRVEIIKDKCIHCGECMKVCPVGAISSDLTIDYNKCRYIRCLRCYDVCKAKAIRILGHSKPKS